jgi:hypothetical protein
VLPGTLWRWALPKLPGSATSVFMPKLEGRSAAWNPVALSPAKVTWTCQLAVNRNTESIGKPTPGSPLSLTIRWFLLRLRSGSYSLSRRSSHELSTDTFTSSIIQYICFSIRWSNIQLQMVPILSITITHLPGLDSGTQQRNVYSRKE